MSSSTKKIEKFFSTYPVVSYSASEVLITPGEKSEYVYFLKKGIVRQYVTLSTGDQFFISFHSPYSIFPLSTAINKTVNNYYFAAHQTSQLYRVPVSDLTKYLNHQPDIYRYLTSELLKILDRVNIRMQILATGRSPYRLAMFLVYMSDSYGVIPPLTHQDIANWIGLTRETVSWQMLHLKEQGMIQYSRRRISILDLPRLQATANFA